MKKWLTLLLLAGVMSSLAASPNPSPVSVFTPSLTVTVLMRVLNADGSSTVTNCVVNTSETRFGCTADGTRGYPYAQNPAVVNIEKDYLLDLVSQEFSPEVYRAPAATRAVAIAARSYTHYYIGNPPNPSFNNSTSYHVFLPYRFEKLSGLGFVPSNSGDPCASNNLNTFQKSVCTAVASKQYIGLSSSDLPAKALYGSDRRYQTVDSTGDKPYLKGVAEPITTNKCDANDSGTGFGGLSQEGASRWARAKECSYDGAPTLAGNLAGGEWGVRWLWSEQILFHYYTNVHLRDLNSLAVLSPDYRWAPLEMSWNGQQLPPRSLTPGGSQTIALRVQNVGTTAWSCSAGIDYQVRIRWLKGSSATTASSINVCGLNPGDSMAAAQSQSIVVPSWGRGMYTLAVDVERTGSGGFFFRNQTITWPQYIVTICSSDCTFLRTTSLFNLYDPNFGGLGSVAGYP